MSTQRRPLKDYGPIQMAERLGLACWQVSRALDDGLIPPPDCRRGRWSAAVVESALARIDDIRATAGTIPDVGAWRAAEILGQRSGRQIEPDTVAELARTGLIPQTGQFKGWPLYCGRALERFADWHALDRAAERGRLLTADQAAERLAIRRCDFDHLVKAGWIEAVAWAHSAWQPRRSQPSVPLFRTADLYVIAHHPAIDWNSVRATPKGRRSPLAVLTSTFTREAS